MNKQERTYLDMELEEAKLESGRYNTDYALTGGSQKAPSLFASFAKLAQGADFNLPSLSGLSTAQSQPK